MTGRPARRRRRRPTQWVRRTLGLVGAGTLAAAVLAACTSSATVPAAPDAGPAVSIPLTSGSASGGAGWATLAMGHLDQPLNTFWELFRLSPDSSTWQLETPRGVASNGGLVTSVSASGAVLGGFVASQFLRFSPLALSADGGRTWQTSVLQWALASVPDSLALSGPGGALALLRSGQAVPLLGGTSGGVVRASAGLSTWSALVSTGALAAESAAAPCHLRAITAVAYRPGSSRPVVGARCAGTDRVGIFGQQGGGWVSLGPVVAGSSGTEVVRLDDTAAGLSVLVRAGSGTSARVVALWGSGAPGTAWATSPALPLAGTTLRSTATTPTGGYVILGSARTGSGRRSAATIEPTSRSWRRLDPPPAGTASVVSTPSGGFDTLDPDQSTLLVDSLTARGWVRTQSLAVPVPYGSSG